MSVVMELPSMKNCEYFSCHVLLLPEGHTWLTQGTCVTRLVKRIPGCASWHVKVNKALSLCKSSKSQKQTGRTYQHV